MKLAAALLLLLAGCTSMQRYGSTRPTPEGMFSGTASMDILVGDDPQVAGDDRAISPVAPRVGLRYGIDADSDAGFEFGTGNGTLDWKRLLLQSRWIDIAIDPTVTAGVHGNASFAIVHAGAPLLVGVNVAPWLTVLPQASVSYLHADADRDGEPGRDAVLVGGALGLYFRLLDGLALQPLAGMTVELDSGYRYLSGGLGISFGILPGEAP